MSSKAVSKGELQAAIPRFSNHHPLLPKRYVPPWQLDMKNRAILIQVKNNNCMEIWLNTCIKLHVCYINYIPVYYIIIQNGKVYSKQGNWKGHVSMFLQGRGKGLH